ncbi:c-type cytochrome biogenesis protein CcsB [Jatrophihabitans sp. YIM 134969]
MAVSETLAHVSDDLFKATTATYALTMVAFTAEYAFGRRGRVARTAVTAPAVAKVPVAVGAGGTTGGSTPSVPAARVVDTSSERRANGDRIGRIGVILLTVGALIHLASVVTRGWSVDRVPWGNMYEFSSVVALLAVAAFLGTLIKAPQIRYLGAFVMFPVLIVMFLAGTVLYARAQTLVPALQSYWLAIHVSSVACAEGLLMTSAVVTVLYLLRQRSDRKVAATEQTDGPVKFGAVSRFGAKLPPAATLDKVAYRIVAFAFPLYTFGVIAGAIWAEAAWGRYWGWDPKETWAFIAWVVYAAYLHARATAGWRGRTAAWINLLGFGAMTFNFFVVNIVIAGLHSYAGLN